MPEKNKGVEEHLRKIEYLLAGILLKKDSNLKQVAKIIKCSDKTLTKLFPERKKKDGKTED